MRLLNVHTLELQDFTGREVPDYCILSHRWGDDEVSYKEFRKGFPKPGAGFQKISNFCALIRSRPRRFRRPDKQSFYKTVVGTVDWVWIDTCKNRQAGIT